MSDALTMMVDHRHTNNKKARGSQEDTALAWFNATGGKGDNVRSEQVHWHRATPALSQARVLLWWWIEPPQEPWIQYGGGVD